MRSLPGYFTSVGLILTFVGPVVALYFAANGFRSGDAVQAKAAIVQLLNAASFKFLTSVSALVSAPLVDIYGRYGATALRRERGRTLAGIEAYLSSWRERIGAGEGTDLRPFFDMVIGILFVLLILVAAQIYFQQAQVDTVASEDAKREAALRRADIAAFLDALAGRLRAGGLSATADHEGQTMPLPLRDVLAVDAAGLPAVETAPAEKLGAALTGLSLCVTLPRSPDPGCSDFARLALDALAVTVGVGALPPGTALPRDRFGDLGSALLAARIRGGDPKLVGASSAAGGRVVTFGTAAAAAGSGGADSGVGGDLVLDFAFR